MTRMRTIVQRWSRIGKGLTVDKLAGRSSVLISVIGGHLAKIFLYPSVLSGGTRYVNQIQRLVGCHVLGASGLLSAPV